MIRTTSIGMLVLLAPLGGCGGGCNSQPTPSSETCTGAARGTVTGLDLGRYDGATYVEYQDGDVIPLASGGQGFPMFILNLRAQGSDLGDCLPQTTTETFRGQVATTESEPLVIRSVLPDTWISGDELLVSFDVISGEMVQLDATAGGVTTSVNLWIDEPGTVDGGFLPDAAL